MQDILQVLVQPVTYRSIEVNQFEQWSSCDDSEKFDCRREFPREYQVASKLDDVFHLSAAQPSDT